MIKSYLIILLTIFLLFILVDGYYVYNNKNNISVYVSSTSPPLSSNFLIKLPLKFSNSTNTNLTKIHNEKTTTKLVNSKPYKANSLKKTTNKTHKKSSNDSFTLKSGNVPIEAIQVSYTKTKQPIEKAEEEEEPGIVQTFEEYFIEEEEEEEPENTEKTKPAEQTVEDTIFYDDFGLGQHEPEESSQQESTANDEADIVVDENSEDEGLIEGLDKIKIKKFKFKEKKIKPRKKKTKKFLKKYAFPLLIAYKLKFFAMIPLMFGGLLLLISTTGAAGFFFALFTAVICLKSGH